MNRWGERVTVSSRAGRFATTVALVDGPMAWDEWKKNTLAQHAEAYPEVWYGIWSGPDSYNSALSRYPGQTMFDAALATGQSPDATSIQGINWTDFPVMNMHPHAWPLYDAAKLIGVEFAPEGVRLTPCLPLDEYRFESPLLGLKKAEAGYSGWYAPQAAGEWRITLRLPESERDRYAQLRVNGAEQPLTPTPEGDFQWTGESAPGEPLRWVLTAGG